MLWRTHQPQWGSPEPRHSLHEEYCSQASTGTCVSCRRSEEEKNSFNKLPVYSIKQIHMWIKNIQQILLSKAANLATIRLESLRNQCWNTVWTHSIKAEVRPMLTLFLSCVIIYKSTCLWAMFDIVKRQGFIWIFRGHNVTC